MMIRIVFGAGLAWLAAGGIILGMNAYEAGFTWIGATILGGAIFLALGHVWEKTTGVHDSKVCQRPAMAWETPCSTCGKDADEFVDGDCPDCNPPIEQAAVRAEVHSDDYVLEAKFDATPWFKQASAAEIVALGNCGWGGNYPADAVARFMGDLDDGIQQVFGYLDVRNTDGAPSLGFECHVDESDARRWITANRPQLLADIGDKSTPVYYGMFSDEGNRLVGRMCAAAAVGIAEGRERVLVTAMVRDTITAIKRDHGEVTDTAVRERIHNTLAPIFRQHYGVLLPSSELRPRKETN